MKKPTTTRKWSALLDLFPGQHQELAAALGVTRQTLWTLQRACHAKRPMELLRKLQAWFAEHGTANGSPAPTITELVRAWDHANSPHEVRL